MKHLAVLICAGALLVSCRDKDDEAAKPASAQSQTPDDDNALGVSLKQDAISRAGIKTQPLTSRNVAGEFVAYGKLEEDPSETFVIHAPVSGTLRAEQGMAWPALGQTLSDGAVLGRVEPRLQPSDRITISAQLATARGELASAAAAVAAAQTVNERNKTLNADNKNISDRALQESEAKLTAEKTRESGARTLVDLLEKSLAGPTPEAPLLTASRGGEVLEVLAQPGESIEQGAPIARLARLDRLLARIELPLGVPPPSSPSARIVATGYEGMSPVESTRVLTSGGVITYRLSRIFPGMRPGTPVEARTAIPGATTQGVMIPRAAIVQQDRRLWVYIKTSETRFARRPVPLDYPAADGYIAAHGFTSGQQVVVTGAQSLLSEEFRNENDVDAN